MYQEFHGHKPSFSGLCHRKDLTFPKRRNVRKEAKTSFKELRPAYMSQNRLENGQASINLYQKSKSSRHSTSHTIDMHTANDMNTFCMMPVMVCQTLIWNPCAIHKSISFPKSWIRKLCKKGTKLASPQWAEPVKRPGCVFVVHFTMERRNGP